MIWRSARSAYNQIALQRTEDWAEHCPQKPKNLGNVGLKFSRSNPMKYQSNNLTKQNIIRIIPLSLYLALMTISGTFSIEDSIASEMHVPNSIPLLSRNSPSIDLSEFTCSDAYDIYQKLLIQNSIMRNAIMRYKN